MNNIKFDLPKNQSNVIKVIGVGGGGSNAVNYMFTQGITGVDFVICNTDAQALQNSSIPNKIQLGLSLTEGLGAGANPEIGEKAAKESIEEVKDMLSHQSKMVFITVGMGGGTGTGAAPVIAKAAKELDLLTIGIVTTPFSFEGKMRNDQALAGIQKLREHLDSLIVINNNKLREVFGNLGFKAGFSKADEVLSKGARAIAEVITKHYTQNIDLKDAKTVLSNSGTAIMGSASASGDDRSEVAISKALDSPLLNDNKITGAKNVLLLIVSGTEEVTLDEIAEINEYIQSEAKSNVNIIMGVGENESLGDAISVTVIATGFGKEQQHEISNVEPKKIIHTLDENQQAVFEFSDEKLGSTEPVHHYSEKVVHQLEIEPEDDFNELVTTTEYIENLDVVFETVSPTENKSLEAEEIPFSFSTYEEEELEIPLEIREVSPQSINDIEVNEPEFVKADTSIPNEKVYYTLEDCQELESNIEKSHRMSFNEQENEESLQLKVKQREEPNVKSELLDTLEDDAEISPMNYSIEELKKKSEDRKEKLKRFNYEFRQPVQKDDEINKLEKEPAFKRQHVDLKHVPHSSESSLSQSSIETGKDLTKTTLKSNNSFLHDNVD